MLEKAANVKLRSESLERLLVEKEPAIEVKKENGQEVNAKETERALTEPLHPALV